MIRASINEIVGLFVDDGMLALALVAWVVIIGLARATFPDLAGMLALLLAAGCVVILLVSVARAVRGVSLLVSVARAIRG